MGGNSFGALFRVSTFGESHGPALGCVIDGCPAGIPLSTENIECELKRRRPGGGGSAATERYEEDTPEILSGIYEGKTLGTPIAVIIRNTNQHSPDYDTLKDIYRPGHADWTWEAKYGFRDHRGGGRSSGRETAGRVAAGAVARAFLGRSGITIAAWTAAIAGINAPSPGEAAFDMAEAERNSLRVPGKAAAEQIGKKLEELRAAGDSAGGIIACRARGIPPGLGEPVFDKLGALLGRAILSIGACKGIEFGAGFSAAASTGSANNDTPLPAEESAGGKQDAHYTLPRGVPVLSFKTSHAGGTLGGISTGGDIEFSAAFKPVASISMEQETVNRSGGKAELEVKGRHDICIVPRAVPVVEAMTALVLADLLLLQRCNRL
jgi:chorismate synthase